MRRFRQLGTGAEISARPRVIVIVGASSGIGRAAARAFARHGDRVVLAGRSRVSLAEVARECRGDGATAMVVPTDVTDRSDVDALFAAAAERFGRVDAVVNTVAVAAYGRFEDVPAEVFDQVLLTNLTGTSNVARRALSQFRSQQGGHLVLVGSLLGKIATPYMGSYVTSKWAVHGLARVLQIEARRTPGIGVSLISPGSVDTPIYAQAANYAGRAGRPPPPVDAPEKVARAILAALSRPRRETSVGTANPLMVTGFRLLPAVFDALVEPLMQVGGLSRRRVPAGVGNVFEPRPAGDAARGSWGRHWLRALGGAGLLAGGVATARAASAARPQRRRSRFRKR
jgi:NAD(P)-dependent dehydrogenase (short-subunit alcohol dehydrogenase family)